MLNDFLETLDWWTIWGFFAQFFFFARFIVQWYVSEKKKKSVVPPAFWYISFVGTILLLVYTIVRRDIVFLVAQILQLVIYIRNIKLIKSEKTSKL